MKQRDREGRPEAKDTDQCHRTPAPAPSIRKDKQEEAAGEKRVFTPFFPTFLNFLPQPFERLEQNSNTL